jgi:hypothetical protein
MVYAKIGFTLNIAPELTFFVDCIKRKGKKLKNALFL